MRSNAGGGGRQLFLSSKQSVEDGGLARSLLEGEAAEFYSSAKAIVSFQ